MRELTKHEIENVNGGSLLANIPGTLGGIALAWEIGYGTGMAVNNFNASQGRSFGQSLHWAFNG